MKSPYTVRANLSMQGHPILQYLALGEGREGGREGGRRERERTEEGEKEGEKEGEERTITSSCEVTL